MKKEVVNCLERNFNTFDLSCLYESNDIRYISSGIRLLSCIEEEIAEELLKKTEAKFMLDMDTISISYFLLSAKELGYTESDMKNYIKILEKEKKRNGWTNQIWLDSLIIKALGKYGISYPNIADVLLQKRYPNGSWYEKVWVSSYALQALFYSYAEPAQLSLTADFLKNSIKKDHYKKERTERGWINKEKVTALALESLLLIGEGYDEEPIRSCIEWTINQVDSSNDWKEIMNLSIPLTYILKGKAQKNTNYRRVDAVHFRETKVEIGEQIQGDKVNGDLVKGDKVKEKLGEGATQLKDSVALRSNIGGSGESGSTQLDNSVAVRSDIGNGKKKIDDSIIRQVAEKNLKVPRNYSVFTGEKIDGGVRYCPSCGTKVESEWKCCVECGYKMEEVRRIFE